MGQRLTPLFSVIVCTRNRCTELPRCISSILGQRFNDFELIIVDGNSSDGTSDYLNMLLQSWDERIVVARQPGRGLPNARNCGIHLSRGKYLLFLDDDTELQEDFMHELKRSYEHLSLLHGRLGGIGAAGSLHQKVLPKATALSILKGMIDYALMGAYQFWEAGNLLLVNKQMIGRFFPSGFWVSNFEYAQRVTKVDAIGGYCMSVERDALFKIGLFNERLGRTYPTCDDSEFCYRMGRSGYTLMIVPKLHLRHYESDKARSRTSAVEESSAVANWIWFAVNVWCGKNFLKIGAVALVLAIRILAVVFAILRKTRSLADLQRLIQSIAFGLSTT